MVSETGIFFNEFSQNDNAIYANALYTEYAIFADAVVLNSIEFWTGNNPIAEAGKVQTITNAQGVEVQVAATESGYQLSSGEEQVNLVYNAEERTWSAESDNQTTKLLQLTEENTANLFVGEEIVEVTLDEQGMERALTLPHSIPS